MGWAKYAEDINEIVLERMDQMAYRKSQHIEFLTVIPQIACPAGVSTEVNSDAEKVALNARCSDKKLYCWGCGKEFVFSAGEQRFYEKKGLHQPKRCKACRETNRIKRLALQQEVYCNA